MNSVEGFMGNGPFRCEKCGAGFDGLRCPECNASASVRQTILHYAVEDQQKTKELCKKQKRYTNIQLFVTLIPCLSCHFSKTAFSSSLGEAFLSILS